jgi:glycosyltransferase involved in cell wall biosynthesis
MLTCAVVIPTLNEAENIADLIEFLYDDRYGDLHVIIVDGGSDDGTTDRAAEVGATVLEEEGDVKPAGARNQGARYAIREFDADVLCFIDGDLKLSDDFVYYGMQPFLDDDDVVAVRTVADAVRDSLLMKIYSPISDMSTVADTDDDSPPPPAHFYRREAFEAVGGFEILGFREDWAFYNKVRKYADREGKRIVFETDCVRYGKLDSFNEFVHQQEWYGRTFVPYLKYAGAKRGFADLFLFKPLGFAFSAVFLLVYALWSRPIFLMFGLPFAIKSTLLTYEAVKHRTVYVFPQLALQVVGNCVFLLGIVKYLIGDARLTRGID